MSQHTDVDVVIVGYGPVGQYLSYKLGRLGWTSVIERFPQACGFPRAVHFDDEVGRLFKTSAWTPKTIRRSNNSTSRTRWVNADKDTLLELHWRGPGRCGWHINNFFHQPDLEDEINAIVTTEPRAQVVRGWEAVEVSRTTTAPPWWPARSTPARTPRRGPSGAGTSSAPTAPTPSSATP